MTFIYTPFLQFRNHKQTLDWIDNQLKRLLEKQTLSDLENKTLAYLASAAEFIKEPGAVENIDFDTEIIELKAHKTGSGKKLQVSLKHRSTFIPALRTFYQAPTRNDKFVSKLRQWIQPEINSFRSENHQVSDYSGNTLDQNYHVHHYRVSFESLSERFLAIILESLPISSFNINNESNNETQTVKEAWIAYHKEEAELHALNQEEHLFIHSPMGETLYKKGLYPRHGGILPSSNQNTTESPGVLEDVSTPITHGSPISEDEDCIITPILTPNIADVYKIIEEAQASSYAGYPRLKFMFREAEIIFWVSMGEAIRYEKDIKYKWVSGPMGEVLWEDPAYDKIMSMTKDLRRSCDYQSMSSSYYYSIAPQFFEELWEKEINAHSDKMQKKAL